MNRDIHASVHFRTEGVRKWLQHGSRFHVPPGQEVKWSVPHQENLIFHFYVSFNKFLSFFFYIPSSAELEEFVMEGLFILFDICMLDSVLRSSPIRRGAD